MTRFGIDSLSQIIIGPRSQVPSLGFFVQVVFGLENIILSFIAGDSRIFQIYLHTELAITAKYPELPK